MSRPALIARVTTQLRYDSSFIAQLKEVDARGEVTIVPPEPGLPQMARLVQWLGDIEALLEKIEEWKVESAFASCLNVVLPNLEKDIGLLVLRAAGADDALHRWMWSPTQSSPPPSGIVSRKDR